MSVEQGVDSDPPMDAGPASTVDWDSAFKSPVFCASLQAAVNAALSKAGTSKEPQRDGRVEALEQLGEVLPATSVAVLGVSTTSNVASREPLSGMLTVPTFIGVSGSTSLSQSSIGGTNPNSNSSIGAGLSSQPIPSVGPIPMAGLNKAFILGPGRPPIPAKLVTQILAHKFVEMTDLIPENLEAPSTEVPTFVIEGRSIVPTTATSTRKKSDSVDILTWIECFTSYMSVITTYQPDRARDLLAYMALIIRMAKQFPGRCWYSYDRAYRLEAAASNLKNWCQLNSDLYHYHTSVAVQTSPSPQASRYREPRGDQNATQYCRSWNTGACNSPRQYCRFRHSCDRNGCGGKHRRIDCHESPRKRGRSPGNEANRYRFTKRD